MNLSCIDHNVLRLCAAVIICWLAQAEMFAQASVARHYQEVDGKFEAGGRQGEMIAALLNSLRAEALDSRKPIILIARLGTGESRRDLNRVRLQRCFTELMYGDPLPTVLKTEGERADGYGRVEIYVNGALKLTILAERNKYIWTTCCENLGAYTPSWYRAKTKRRSAK